MLVPEKTQAVVVYNTGEGEGQEAVVEVVLQVEEVVMQLVVMVMEMVIMMVPTTMASKEEEGLEVLTDAADLQVDAVVETGEVVVVIRVEEVVVIHLTVTMTTEHNTEIAVDSGCTA